MSLDSGVLVCRLVILVLPVSESIEHGGAQTPANLLFLFHNIRANAVRYPNLKIRYNLVELYQAT